CRASSPRCSRSRACAGGWWRSTAAPAASPAPPA
ncbi:MAG: hypothetical protein AVDCRST_MAG11-2571, partial [uncultured Gemmatimonadaceae bacterium]